MTPPVQAAYPLDNLGCCSLVTQCEFLELACRIVHFVKNVFLCIGQVFVDTILWVLDCEVTDETPNQGDVAFNAISLESLAHPSTDFAKLKIYQQLPKTSPAFEHAAIKMAGMWLSPDEMEQMKNHDPQGFIAFAKIIVRASIFGNPSTITFDLLNMEQAAPYLKFTRECHAIADDFLKLPSEDKKAILDHFDSEINRETRFLVPATPEDCKHPRKFIPEQVEISPEAATWWKKHSALAQQGYGNMKHPVMQMMMKIFPQPV